MPTTLPICPLTGERFTDPVVDPEGNTFERAAILKWLATNSTSPITRTPLTPAMLTPNRVLKDMLAAEDAADPTAAAAAAATPPPAPATPARAGLSLQTSPTEPNLLTLTVTPPAAVQRAPADVVVVIDTSGSMSTEATMQNSAGKTEAQGLSLLDIVKHSVKTVIRVLEAGDRLAVVSFNHTARQVLPLTAMDAAGKQKAELATLSLRAGGSTNLWDGLKEALDVVNEQPVVGRVASVLLLTDGVPNVEPPRGHLPMLQRYRDEHKGQLNCGVHTFGFGYNLDSPLLHALAVAGDGGYSFIPDASFVGTAFVNATSNVLSTMAHGARLALEVDGGGSGGDEVVEVLGAARGTGVQAQATSWGVEVRLGPLQFGQPRSVVVRAPPGVTATLSYELFTGQRVVVRDAAEADGEGDIDGRLRFADVAADVLAELRDPADADAALAAAQARVAALAADLEGPLLEDVAGQVTQAVSRADWWRKWGRHYLPALQRAHVLQMCANFKDPGLQVYGGALFQRLRDAAEAIFLAMPPPKPCARGRHSRAAPSSMRSFHNRAGPCFDGACLVRMADGSRRPVRALARGDRVASARGGGGGVSEVTCVVETRCEGASAELVELDGGEAAPLLITPWHPVRVGGAWKFPGKLAPPRRRPCNAVFSFVVRRADAAAPVAAAAAAPVVVDAGAGCYGENPALAAAAARGAADEPLDHVMEIEGVEVATLGHGFAVAEPVIGHPFFGSMARVAADLARADPVGWARGHVRLEPGCLARADPATGLVTGIQQPERSWLFGAIEG